MAMLGSNERQHPWMDEGVNTYFEFKYEAIKYRYNASLGSLIPEEMQKLSSDAFLDAVYSIFFKMSTKSPIATSSEELFNRGEYFTVAYEKAAVWMYMVRVSLGENVFDKAIKNYFNEWKFKHPQPADMKASFEKAANRKMNSLFALLNKAGYLQ